MKFTHKILLLPILAALGFVALAGITWRGNEESRRLSEEINERFFANLELSLRLQNVALRTRQSFLTAISADLEIGLEEAEERLTEFRGLVEDGLQRPRLDAEELRSVSALFEGYYRRAVPAAHVLATKEFSDITDDEFTAIEEMNEGYQQLNDVLIQRTARSQAEMDEALATSQLRQFRRQRVATTASIVGLVLLLGLSSAVIASVLGPLRKIMRGTESIAAGDLYQKIDHESRDTLGRLADSFRKMQRSLIQDTNRRKRAESALRSSEERLALAFDVASDGLWDIEFGGERLHLSPRYFAILGYPPSERPRRVPPIVELCRPEERERVRQAWHAHAKEGKPLDAELDVRRRDGTWCRIRARGKIVEEDTTGAPLRSIGTIAEVTSGEQVSATLPDPLGVDTVLQDVGRPLGSLLSSSQSIVSAAAGQQASLAPAIATLDLAQDRTLRAVNAASRWVALRKDPQATLSVEDLVAMVAALVGCEVQRGDRSAQDASKVPATRTAAVRDAMLQLIRTSPSEGVVWRVEDTGDAATLLMSSGGDRVRVALE